MRLLAVLLGCVAAGWAQNPAPSPAPSPSPVVSAPAWVQIRGSFGSQPSAGVDLAYPAVASVGLVSITSHDFVRIPARPYVKDITSSGFAFQVRSIGRCGAAPKWCITAYVLGQVGAAVSSANTTLSYDGGAWAMIQLGTTKWTAGAGWKQFSGPTGTEKQPAVGFGRRLN